MFVTDNNQLGFIHIPRTGGTSVAMSFTVAENGYAIKHVCRTHALYREFSQTQPQLCMVNSCVRRVLLINSCVDSSCWSEAVVDLLRNGIETTVLCLISFLVSNATYLQVATRLMTLR